MASGTAAPIPIVHLISGLATGGTEMMLYKVLRGLQDSGFSNTVISLTGRGALAEPIEALGVPVESLGMRRGMPSAGGLLHLVRTLRRVRPTVLQTWLYHADLLGLVAGSVAGVPAIVWNIRCSVMDERYERGLGRAVLRLLAFSSGLPAIVVSNSQAGIDLHRTLGYHPRRWELVPNGFDLGRFKPDPDAYASVRTELGIRPDTLLVGLIARLDPIKEHATFFRAAGLVMASLPDVHFVLAGSGVDGSNPEIAAMTSGLDARRIHLFGERKDIARLTAALDIASCTSSGEGFPNILGEAMACGVPVVTTDVGDARRIVEDEARIVPVRDPAALARAWERLLRSPQGRRTAGTHGREILRQRYSLEAVTARYADLYRQLAR